MLQRAETEARQIRNSVGKRKKRHLVQTFPRKQKISTRAVYRENEERNTVDSRDISYLDQREEAVLAVSDA